MSDPKFHPLPISTESLVLPTRLAYPFNYSPHPLGIAAAKQLQYYLDTWKDVTDSPAQYRSITSLDIGKMFGVLVVLNEKKELGFLAAYSGMLGVNMHHPFFVPPIYDRYEEASFFRQGEKEIIEMNKTIEDLKNNPRRKQLKESLSIHQSEILEKIKAQKDCIQVNRANRAKLRKDASDELCDKLNEESKFEQLTLKKLKKALSNEIKAIKDELQKWEQMELVKKQQRKQLSQSLQERLFEQFSFLNYQGESQSLQQLFANTIWSVPPSGAGECAAPKLFQYAFKHQYQPVALTEFWWGPTPASEIRVHGQYYSCCRGKCGPILNHMLAGLQLDKNPMQNLAENAEEPIILSEDEHILVVDKPHGLLSVPGKEVRRSVLTYVKNRYPHANGPMIVHRLDQSTSGVMIIALTEKAYLSLQQQFMKRSVHKEYLAILDGVPKQKSGEICLPLRVDLEDRPRQLVCERYGKYARTKWKIQKIKNGKSLIHFEPITGRTHQLRVHAAHPKGLGIPILGDELYGQTSERLYLHAKRIRFLHPGTAEEMTFESTVPFDW